MWQLKRIEAKNICTFQNLDYTLLQNTATLVFGNNLDNDSQNSNGSGKSAMLEAISIALTGTPLRKVDSLEDIINDAESECTISATLFNDEQNKIMTINRLISRKNPQQIQIIVQTGPYDPDVEEIRQATVNDYNKWILETIGLTKDEIFANFILSRTKYQSFLTCSDKEKKEIINRFSNGIIVDESIEALHSDMQPIQESLSTAEKSVAECNGRVSALEGEIERAINETATRRANKQLRIEGWKKSIAEKREDIRTTKENIASMEDTLDKYDAVYNEIAELEDSDMELADAYRVISAKLESVHVSVSDYRSKMERLQGDLAQNRGIAKTQADVVSKMQEKLNEAMQRLEAENKTYNEQQERIYAEEKKVNGSIETLVKKLSAIRANTEQLNTQRKQITSSIARLEQALAGIIVCPKCKHEFTLANDLDIAAAKKELVQKQQELCNIQLSITDMEQEYDSCVNENNQARKRQNELVGERAESNRLLHEIEAQVNDWSAKLSTQKSNMAKLQSSIERIEHDIQTLRTSLFNETFDVLDRVTKTTEQSIEAAKGTINSLEGAIKTYEESIHEAQNSSDDDVIENLKVSKAKYEKELTEAILNKEKIESELLKYKQQESTFMEFKTHLANTKINAIAQITNEFLEVIGSDMRIAFSGYTVLKSGKVRDKISISLLRNGVDCGAFGKLSQGEQARIQLATILAMWKLSNINCEEGKGLNLLIIDEILDASDEMGLANVFAALNKMQITSLVVSHGNIAEGYQHKLVVTKQNGISTI